MPGDHSAKLRTRSSFKIDALLRILNTGVSKNGHIRSFMNALPCTFCQQHIRHARNYIKSPSLNNQIKIGKLTFDASDILAKNFWSATLSLLYFFFKIDPTITNLRKEYYAKSRQHDFFILICPIQLIASITFNGSSVKTKRPTTERESKSQSFYAAIDSHSSSDFRHNLISHYP